MAKTNSPKYKGTKITTNGNQLVALYTEARIADAGIFYPITPSTEQGENFEYSFARGELNVFGNAKCAIETEGEHAAQGGAIAFSVTGKRVVNFTSSQGILYGLEQYFHAPGKLSTMVLEVASRAVTKHALNVHCAHDDIYSALDTGWTILYAKDAQQASDQAIILRKVNELALNPGINGQDGFLTSHVERSFLIPDADLIREFLGRADDIIDCPTNAQKELFGPKRRRVPEMYDLKNPLLLGPVQNQEHYMNGVSARRTLFADHILKFLEDAYQEFGDLTGRYYGLLSEYNTEHADTVFVSLGSSAENIEAGIDYIKARDGIDLGVIHVNVIRPFPEKAIINALKGKKNVIILERTDSPSSGDNPLTRDIKSALYKAVENSQAKAYPDLPTLKPEEMPHIFSGIYGLGSRDFRPEAIIGAYEYVLKNRKRQDGALASEGNRLFYLGINHPYNVESDDKPSLLPEKAIAVRFHSIGGWGAITTGKNLSEILGELGTYIKNRDFPNTEKEILHISANPKYGSEKKGAPTNYFLVVAPERIRVNCDLRHVDVVLCGDPKAFTHTNPLMGLKEGGAFIWENSSTNPDEIWQHIPVSARKEIIEKNIKVFTLSGFKIARSATSRTDLQLRMQGNSFLGAFFRVSSFLSENKIPEVDFEKVVEKQYKKKFGKLGSAVINSNMTVMKAGFDQVKLLNYGDINAPDKSSFSGTSICPLAYDSYIKGDVDNKPPLYKESTFDKEFRAGLGYNQPASAFASTGAIAVGTGSKSSKFVSRRKIPKYNPQNCTQCLECVVACPDSALPNTAQDIQTVLEKAVEHYVSDDKSRTALLGIVKKAEALIRTDMIEELKNASNAKLFSQIAVEHISKIANSDPEIKVLPNIQKSLEELSAILLKLPLAYAKTAQIFSAKEKKEAGTGGLFGIFVSDKCKGCGQCVVQCGNRKALEMVEETEDIHADLETTAKYLQLLPETDPKYLGLFNAENPEETKSAALRYLLMQQSSYNAIVSGDGACAGCGEKTILRTISAITESYMRPIYKRKAERLTAKVQELKTKGLTALDNLQKRNPDSYDEFIRTVLHTLMGFGGENLEDTKKRVKTFKGTNKDIIDAIIAVMQQDAYNHQKLQVLEGKLANGMSVMGMTASTGCNSVYSSTPPANPHTYPWMNSLFQDGATIGWLVGESFIQNNARRSVVPERLCDAILSDFEDGYTEQDYFRNVHFNDRHMTDREIQELPKIWAVGGDGAFGDIGFQNVSKAIMQNRPNFNCVMLDTQVYSNTGGQNSDSSVMPGGFDMNQYGSASQGKLTEKKEVAQILTIGHGSPFVSQVSVANTGNLFKAVLDGLIYRGASFVQAYTPCMPEHAIGDDMASVQAKRARDSRGMPEFIYNPTLGDGHKECLSLKGNPDIDRDWYTVTSKKGEKYLYTIVQWASTEGRFRNHIKKAPENYETECIKLDDILLRVTQQDVVNRRVFDKKHYSYIPKFNVYTKIEQEDGTLKPVIISRQMVLFCIERRRNWRRLQDLAGIQNKDQILQKNLLDAFKKSEISIDEFAEKANEFIEQMK